MEIANEIKEIEDIVPYVRKYLLPAIEDATEVCRRSFFDDPYNDSWIFGTHFWKNSWNRFKEIAERQDSPIELYGQGNEYKMRLGPFVIRHHRVDRKTRIPRAGKAAKLYADMIQLSLWDDMDTALRKDNIIIAIDADEDYGLREVFIGELENYSPERNKYQWRKRALVHLADDAEPSNEEFVQFAEGEDIIPVVPEEKIPEVPVGLDESKRIKKDLG